MRYLGIWINTEADDRPNEMSTLQEVKVAKCAHVLDLEDANQERKSVK